MINVADVLDEFSQTIIKRTKVITTVDFVPTETVTDVNILAVVQAAQKEKLNVPSIDWSKRYLQIHSKDELAINDLIVYKTKEYKIIELADYSDYGYYDAIAEEIK